MSLPSLCSPIIFCVVIQSCSRMLTSCHPSHFEPPTKSKKPHFALSSLLFPFLLIYGSTQPLTPSTLDIPRTLDRDQSPCSGRI